MKVWLWENGTACFLFVLISVSVYLGASTFLYVPVCPGVCCVSSFPVHISTP